RPEELEGGVDVPLELSRIEPVVPCLDGGPLLGAQHASRQEAPVRRGGGVVALGDPGPVAAFADQLADRLAEVQVVAHQRVVAPELGQRRLRTVAIVAHQLADSGPVALLGPGLVGVLVGPAPGTADALAAAPRLQQRVEELATVVGVQLAAAPGGAGGPSAPRSRPAAGPSPRRARAPSSRSPRRPPGASSGRSRRSTRRSGRPGPLAGSPAPRRPSRRRSGPAPAP